MESLKKKKKNNRDLKISNDLIYSEKNFWSPSFKAWSRYRVEKPRLPNDIDKQFRWVDSSDNCPRNFSAFIGRHNDEIIKSFQDLIDSYGKNKTFADMSIIHGKNCS